jgi:hypothetical protein
MSIVGTHRRIPQAASWRIDPSAARARAAIGSRARSRKSDVSVPVTAMETSSTW